MALNHDQDQMESRLRSLKEQSQEMDLVDWHESFHSYNDISDW